ncbi:uncharacterized protein LOC110724221 [Chenopodium quinoa]|uniref:uncharacterized protein LOC110724221 n=1 Tax=Chenopodium quinoa TaxID=63459 RepID=UPI000B79622B|nr:uncharacterized protein LOC110724221 [Chenopodium quinoa]
MSLTINNPINCATPRLPIHHHHQRQFLPSSLSLSSRTSTLTVVAATGKFTSRTGKFDSKNRRGSSTTTKDDAAASEEKNGLRNFEENVDLIGDSVDDDEDDLLPELPGDKPDFWEGPQWDGLGFFVQYMWAFGILFALISSGIAVATYNEGATDFRETPAYKESIQSKDLLEGPEGSDADVFESNPTEEAPALD